MSSYTSHLLEIPSQISTIATHPSKPLFSVGTISGHVHTYTWSNGIIYDDPKIGTSGNLTAGYNLLWKTKRHKGSCRSLSYSHDGDLLYSVGTDNIIKAANVITGIVTSKLAVPQLQSKSTEEDHPTYLLSLTPQHLVLGTDLGNLHIYDTRDPSKPPTTHLNVHSSYISSITPLPPTTSSTSNLPKSFVTTGDCTISIFDVHKGLITTSEPQDDEILSSCVVAGVGKGRRYTRAYVGMGEGTIHAFERGIWKDMVERIKVAKKEVELDVMVDASKCGFLGQGENGVIAVGCGDGVIKIVKLGDNRVIHELEHKAVGDDEDEEGVEEGITALAVDCDGALISGGGECVRIWYEKEELEKADSKEKETVEEKDSDDSAEDGDDGKVMEDDFTFEEDEDINMFDDDDENDEDVESDEAFGL